MAKLELDPSLLECRRKCHPNRKNPKVEIVDDLREMLF